jgi:hypothetical protein
MSELTVKIAFDEKSKVWVTWDSQVPGLTAIDGSRDGLLDQIEKVVPELLDMNRESTLLPPDNQYDIMVVEQTPPIFVEQPATSSSHLSRSFHVPLVK